MKKYLFPTLIIVLGLGLGLLMVRPYGARNQQSVSLKPNILSDFETLDIWGISPDKGFSVTQSKEHVTEGTYSLKVVYPQGGLPSINTRKLNQAWGEYDYFCFDVFNPLKEDVSFSIRLDDASKKRINIPYTLRPGLNKVRLARSQIASKIDAGNIGFVVLFLNEPSKRYTLFFDNMRLEKSNLIPGLENTSMDALQKKAEVLQDEKPLPMRKAVAVPKPMAPLTGELRVPVAKLKKVDADTPFISTGVPFALGQLQSEKNIVFVDDQNKEIPVAVKVLARWPQDNSIRSVLVQFRYKIPNIYQYVTMKWGVPRSTQDLLIVEPVWDYPEGYLLLPSTWLCSSDVIGEQVRMGKSDYPEYDRRIESSFESMRDRPWTGDLIQDGYYSTPHVFYQIFVRSGELKHFLAARKELVYYRDGQLIQEGPERGRSTIDGKSRYIYVDAVVDDYLLTGDPRSLTMAGFMAEYLKTNFSPDKAYYRRDQKNFFTERDIAFPFLGIITYYELTGEKEYLDIARQYMDNLYKTQLEWPSRGGFIHNLYAHDPEEGCRQDEYGGSPFMTGLIFEPIIKYHRLTGDEKAADSIFRALDWLINEGLVSTGDSFKYLTCDQYVNASDDPDVNLLVVHGFGYGYRISGYQNENYLAVGNRVFERGIKEANFPSRKHFNQNYRSSGHFLAYIQHGPQRGKMIADDASESPSLETKNVLYYDDFEETKGRFVSLGDVDLTLDTQNTYLNGKSLSIRTKYLASHLSAGVELETWNVDLFSKVSFSYRIPSKVPVGMRVKTEYGDWVCIGGTSVSECADPRSPVYSQLQDDDAWHEIEIDVKNSAKAVLARISRLKAFQFYTQTPGGMYDEFWIDDFRIRK